MSRRAIFGGLGCNLVEQRKRCRAGNGAGKERRASLFIHAFALLSIFPHSATCGGGIDFTETSRERTTVLAFDSTEPRISRDKNNEKPDKS